MQRASRRAPAESKNYAENTLVREAWPGGSRVLPNPFVIGPPSFPQPREFLVIFVFNYR